MDAAYAEESEEEESDDGDDVEADPPVLDVAPHG